MSNTEDLSETGAAGLVAIDFTGMVSGANVAESHGLSTFEGAQTPIPGRVRDERVSINKEFASFEAFIEEYVTNISKTGVFIRAQSPLPVGSRVNLCFTVFMNDIETIEGIGEVVRVEKDGMGVVFAELSSYSRKLIERLLTKTPG
jgi:PilZ domain